MQKPYPNCLMWQPQASNDPLSNLNKTNGFNGVSPEH
jgi:hypothetical protein